MTQANGPQPHAIAPADGEAAGHNLVAAPLRKQWLDNGFVTLPGVFSPEEVAAYNAVVNHARTTVDDGKDAHGFGDRIGQLHQAYPALLELPAKSSVTDFLTWAFGEPPVLFGSLNFERGTQQEAHIDAIFFWPEPAYAMAGVWVALEDVDPEAGPLFYISGSHKWPFFHSDDVVSTRPDLATAWHHARAHGESDDIVGKMGVAWTADFLTAERERQAPRILPPLKAGDVVVWHSLLAHGGSPRNNAALSRKSAVFHFFGGTAKLYTFSQFMLNGRDELPILPPTVLPRAQYGSLEYMKFPSFTTYSNGVEIHHPVENTDAG
jgi:hypothetical protein